MSDLYPAIGRIANDIDSDLGYMAAKQLHMIGKIADDQFKMIIGFETLIADGVGLTPRQRGARRAINKDVLHSFTESELLFNYDVADLHEKTIARNGWRWEGDKYQSTYAEHISTTPDGDDWSAPPVPIEIPLPPRDKLIKQIKRLYSKLNVKKDDAFFEKFDHNELPGLKRQLEAVQKP